MSTLGIALIGYGAMGRAHAMGYRDIVHHYGLRADAHKIVGVATTRLESAQAAAAELGCEVATTDWRSLLARDDVHIVDICTPHDAHLDQVVAAAQAGKHIYCEKPLARTLDEAQQIHAAVKAAGVVCAMTFNFRFFPCVQRAKQLLDEGFCGRVFSFHGRYFRASYIDAAAADVVAAAKGTGRRRRADRQWRTHAGLRAVAAARQYRAIERRAHGEQHAARCAASAEGFS